MLLSKPPILPERCANFFASMTNDGPHVSNRPGWEKDSHPLPLPSRHWSGYLEVPGAEGGVDGQGKKFYHYWFVSARQ